MSIAGPIVIVDDDVEDQDLMITALRQMELPNEIKAFQSGQEVLEYLQTTEDKPFIIICDIRMATMNGLELRKHIQSDPYLRRKSIPFVYFTAAVSQPIINDAYEMTVQGFFEKGKTYTDLQEHLRRMIDYWKTSLHPNRFP